MEENNRKDSLKKALHKRLFIKDPEKEEAAGGGVLIFEKNTVIIGKAA